jgi:hypothetical protein
MAIVTIKTVNAGWNHSKLMRMIPILVLTAMNPSLSNAKQPMKVLPLCSEFTAETYAPSSPEAATPHTIVYTKAQKGTKPRFGLSSLIVIRKSKIVKCNGETYNMVLADKHPESNNYDPKSVDEVYLFKCDANGNIDNKYYKTGIKDSKTNLYEAPCINSLIYHNLGGDKTFAGAEILEHRESPDILWGVLTKYEVRFDNDEDAQYLINFMSRETQWKYNMHINFIEKNTPELEGISVEELR